MKAGKKCIVCDKYVNNIYAVYCSNKCQGDYQYQRYIKLWKVGRVNRSRGVSTRCISKHIARYLYEKYDNTCVICGWKVINPHTGKVPLEIDHIDGNSENNLETNLQLICPNCHSLTSNYRNLNRGNGREWRRIKYVKIID